MSETTSTFEGAFPDAVVETLTELQYSDDRRGPWKLYIYEPNSQYHRGGVWFMAKPRYPEEGEITIADAVARCVEAVTDGREIRICDRGDMLVYHSRAGRVIHGENFWQEITRS